MEPLSIRNSSGPEANFVSSQNPVHISAGADAKLSCLKQVQVTLTDANTVYTVGLPTTARGFTLYPSTADVIFAVGEDPAALATKAGATVAADFGVGATAPFGLTTTRVMVYSLAQSGGDLRLRSATASAVVVVGIF